MKRQVMVSVDLALSFVLFLKCFDMPKSLICFYICVYSEPIFLQSEEN